MISIEKCFRLLDEGFSLLTVGENKKPNFSWKPEQSKPISKIEFEKRYNYKGGIKLKDGTELAPTNNIGFITGYDYLEVIDIDLKVFSTLKEKKEFWEDFSSYLEDNIADFKEKFVIYKTKNEGFHILYKSKRVEGSQVLAKLKGHKQAVIETRGIGGYVFLYDGNNQTDFTYLDVQFISDEDRNFLFEISKAFNYKEPEIIQDKKKEFQKEGLKTWDDYNQKTSIIDLISDEFTIVRNLKDRYIIKRFGAESPHSGYVFKENNIMYLFSTGTHYEAEKGYTAFHVYCKKYHNNDFSAGAKDLYQKGYGDRLKVDVKFDEEKIVIPENDLIFPIDIFPKNIQNYMVLCNQTLNNSYDYMGCSMLFLTSIIVGNSTIIEVKNGWTEPCNLWLALVGKAGIGKTPSINSITFPLDKLNNREIKTYVKNYDKYEKYLSLSEDEKKLSEKVKKPNRSQFIVKDITIEALIDLHNENKNGIGVKNDELAGWFKDMNKYRAGSDLEHWLSSWSGQQINMNRKTSKSSFVQRAFMPVLGGIQPSIMDGFYTDENKESGFIDRMLFCYPDLEPNYYNENEMNVGYINWYDNFIISFYDYVKKNIIYDNDNEIEPKTARLDDEAKKEWVRIHDFLIDFQKSDDENEYMKSMIPKQISYIPRFSLLIHCLDSFNESKNQFLISRESVLKAEKLSKYFIAMAKKIKSNSSERKDLKSLILEKKGTNYEKFVSVYSKDKNVNKSELANILGISRTMIYKYINNYEKDGK